MLLHDRLPIRVRRMVSNRLPNLLLHSIGHNQSLRVLHHEHLLRLPRRQYRHVRNPELARSSRNPHGWRYRLRTVSIRKRHCSNGESELPSHRPGAGRLHGIVHVLLQRLCWGGELPRRNGVGQLEVARVDGGHGHIVRLSACLVGEFLYAVFYQS